MKKEDKDQFHAEPVFGNFPGGKEPKMCYGTKNDVVESYRPPAPLGSFICAICGTKYMAGGPGSGGNHAK
jgi:hypothetical protein